MADIEAWLRQSRSEIQFSGAIMIVIKHLLRFSDFKDLDDISLVDVAKHSMLNNYQPEERIIAEKSASVDLYLLKGALDLQTTGGVQQAISSDSERAQAPIFYSNTPGHYARCTLPCKIIQIEKSVTKKYGIQNSRKNNHLDYAEFDTMQTSSANLELVNEITDLFKSNAVTLPSLPEIALHINSALNNESLGANKLAQIIQMDPVITARIVQVGNSALYVNAGKSHSIQDSIARIGIDSIRNIVMGVVLRDLFMPDTELVVHKMAQFYEHSIRIGVICYELAKHIPDLNADRAFLFGLLHDIGVIPILVVADTHKELAHKESNLNMVLQQLKSHIGGMILQQWKFDKELIESAKHAYDWKRNTDKADYCDLVQVALMHSHLVGGEKITGPDLFDLAAFKRLGLEELNLVDNITALKEIGARITELIRMICKS